MRRMLVGLLLTALLLGCGGTDGSKEKYFGGETVEHWLAGVKSPDPKARKKAADMLGNIGVVDARASDLPPGPEAGRAGCERGRVTRLRL